MLLEHLPRSFAARWISTVQDLRSVGARLRGHHPPPFHARQGRAIEAVAGRKGLSSRRLRVVDMVAETREAVRLVLEDPTGAPIEHRPGQFLTLSIEVEGKAHRRAYSIAWASEDARRVAIGVKRVAGGVVSSHLVGSVRSGAVLEVLGPSGDFSPRDDDRGDLVLIAGGSGVTPLVRIAAWALAERPTSRVALVLGNRSRADVMFGRDIEELSARFGDRLAVVHVLDHREGTELSGGDGAGAVEAGALQGPLDRVALDRALRELSFEPVDATWFVCGPTPMMDEARALLDERGVDRGKIREERFGRPELRVAADTASVSHPVTFRLRSGTREVRPRPSATLLEAGLEAGVPLAYSCGLGGCGACRVRLVSGEVAMAEPSCLDAEERASGWVLACVATACTPVTVEAP